jgi:hypothetical protein
MAHEAKAWPVYIQHKWAGPMKQQRDFVGPTRDRVTSTPSPTNKRDGKKCATVSDISYSELKILLVILNKYYSTVMD